MRTEQHHEQGTFVARERFPRLPEAVKDARDWAREAYVEVGGKDSETCALLVSEVVTNAVKHAAAGSYVEVTLWWSLEVEVWDSSPTRPVARKPDDDAEGGRGLQLVQALASEFEVIPAGVGKIVKFRLPS